MPHDPAIAAFRIRRPEVVSEIFDGEAVVVDLRLGRYYSLSPLAAELWRRLEAEPTLDELEAAFAARWEGNGHEQLAAFLDRLLAAELIDRSTRSVGAPPVGLEPVARHDGELELESFDDLEELLVLDPIHELDENGWPLPQNRAEEPVGE